MVSRVLVKVEDTVLSRAMLYKVVVQTVLKLVEVLLDVCEHGDVTYALAIVPVNGETSIEGSHPVDGDSI